LTLICAFFPYLDITVYLILGYSKPDQIQRNNCTEL
jgi:hypothetical protein